MPTLPSACNGCRRPRPIDGHTHRPADHLLGEGLKRQVLSDWSLDHAPMRAQILRLHADGSSERIDWR